MKNSVEFPDLVPPQPFVIDEICRKASYDIVPPFESLVQAMSDTKSQSKDKKILGFRDCENVDGIPNMKLLMVI